MEHNNLTIKTYMTIMAERDAAIRERNMALDERKRFLAERDMAMLQRDAALVERNSALQERNEALAALRQRSMTENDLSRPDLTEPETAQGPKQIHYDHQMNHMFDLAKAEYDDQRDAAAIDDDFKVNTGAAVGTSKPVKVKIKEKKTEGSSKQVSPGTSNGWDNEDLFGDEEDSLGFNEINFEEPTMPVPFCSCSGVPQPCYKWGNGGWQSACCTASSSKQTDPSAHGSNKRGPRGGGRKMSGTVFNKLLNRLVDEGHDLFTPLDLKDHWAKHGTKRPGSSK